MMKKIFAMVLVAAMVMIGACALAENRITEEAAKQIALENGIVVPPWD